MHSKIGEYMLNKFKNLLNILDNYYIQKDKIE